MRYLLICLFLLSACDSPLRHKVREEKGSGNSLSFLSFQESGFELRFQWLKGPYPNVSKTSALMVYVYKDGDLVALPADRQINFYATMPEMGHALDQPGYFEELSPGIYLNQAITFNMTGDWQMELWLQDLNADILEKVSWAESL